MCEARSVDTLFPWILIFVFIFLPIIIAYSNLLSKKKDLNKFVTYFSFFSVFILSFGIFSFVFLVTNKKVDWTTWLFVFVACGVHCKLLIKYQKVEFGSNMRMYWSIFWRFMLCSFIISSIYQQFTRDADERYIKESLSLVFVCHALFFVVALITRQYKISEGFWRDLFDADELKSIYIVFIVGALVMSILNLVIALNFATDRWVDFKLFGTFIYAFLMPGIASKTIAIFRRTSVVSC